MHGRWLIPPVLFVPALSQTIDPEPVDVRLSSRWEELDPNGETRLDRWFPLFESRGNGTAMG